jgi:hypothetical protein
VRWRCEILTLAALASGCVGPLSETRESHYADVAAARQDGAFTRGWLPEVVPPEAKDIWEQHQVDAARTWACFVVPEGPEAVRSLLKGLGARRFSGPVSPGPPALFGTRAWWPYGMSKTPLEAYEFAEPQGGTVVVGISPANRKVCLHRRG